MSLLQHNNIIKMYGCYSNNIETCLILEYAQNGNKININNYYFI